MQYEGGLIDDTGPRSVMQEGMIVGGAEIDGIAGVLWDVAGTQAVTPRDTDVIYRLYRQERSAPGEEAVRPMRGRCFISEPQRPYALGDRVMLETRDGQHVFGTVSQVREMRTGSVSLILDVE